MALDELLAVAHNRDYNNDLVNQFRNLASIGLFCYMLKTV